MRELYLETKITKDEEKLIGTSNKRFIQKRGLIESEIDQRFIKKFFKIIAGSAALYGSKNMKIRKE